VEVKINRTTFAKRVIQETRFMMGLLFMQRMRLPTDFQIGNRQSEIGDVLNLRYLRNLWRRLSIS